MTSYIHETFFLAPIASLINPSHFITLHLHGIALNHVTLYCITNIAVCIEAALCLLTEDGCEETAALWEAEDVCVDDFPAVVVFLHDLLVVVHVVTCEVVPQYTGLMNKTIEKGSVR